MIPKTPQEGPGLDQLELKQDEEKAIRADLAENERKLMVAKEYKKDKLIKDLEEEISTQEKYLEDLVYDIKMLEVSTDGEPTEDEEDGRALENEGPKIE